MRTIKLLLEKILCMIVRTFCKQYIIFESVPDFADNTYPVFNELVKRGYGKKYKLAWYIDTKRIRLIKNDNSSVIVNLQGKTKAGQWIINILFYHKIKARVSCNRNYCYPYPETYTSFFLTHGVPIKHTKEYYTIPETVNYVISPSKEAAGIISYEFDYDYKRIIPLGYPRNDVFFDGPIDLKRVFNRDYKKIVIWLPTFRQNVFATGNGDSPAIPIIHDKENARVINQLLVDRNILVVIKPHFSQDTSRIEELNLSNILFINDTILAEKGLVLYQLLNNSDGLLTDYSSVFCDYLLRNKPIGLIWEDIEEYKRKPGLYPRYKEITVGTHKIYKMQELLDFFAMIADGMDPLAKERQQLCALFNDYYDGNSTKRVVDFIIREAKL